jgi:hypothetical protein
MSNPETLKIQKMLGEARRTLSERKAGWEKVLAHMAEQGIEQQAIDVKEEEFHERIKDMAAICDLLEMAVMSASEVGSGAQLISYQGEAMLSNWSETAAAGRKVEFWLPEGADAPDEHPFKYYTRRLRGSPGTRFQMVLVEIDDDDRPLPRGSGESKPRLTQNGELVGGALAKHAGRLCRDSDFHEYLKLNGMKEIGLNGDTVAEHIATEYVRQTCNIESRKELDHNREAELAYQNKIVRPFNHWIEGQPGKW